MNFERTGKYYYLRLIRLKGSPRALALGAAIGVFIGITPTIPFHTGAILFLTIATRSSFISGLITSWIVCNPLTCIPLYYLSLKIGNYITPYTLNWDRVKAVLEMLMSDISFLDRIKPLMAMGYEAIVVMLVGGCLLAIPFAVASYYISYNVFDKFSKKRRDKHILH